MLSVLNAGLQQRDGPQDDLSSQYYYGFIHDSPWLVHDEICIIYLDNYTTSKDGLSQQAANF